MNLEDFINKDLKNLVYDFKYNKKSNISAKAYSKMVFTILVLLCVLSAIAMTLNKMYTLSFEYNLMIILIFILGVGIVFTIKQKKKLNTKETDKMFELIEKQALKNVFNEIEKVNEKCMYKNRFKNIFFRNVNTFKNSDTYIFKDNRRVRFHNAIFTTLIGSDCSYYTADYVSQTYYDNKENKMEVFCKGIILEINLNIDTKIKAYFQSNKNIYNVRKILKTTKESMKEKRIEAWNIDNKRKINYAIEISKDQTKKDLYKEDCKSVSKIDKINEHFNVYSINKEIEDSRFEDLYNRILNVEEKYLYSHDFAFDGNKLFIYVPLKEFYNYTLFKSLDLVLNMTGMTNKENRLYEKYSRFLEITNKQYKEILGVKNNYLKNL